MAHQGDAEAAVSVATLKACGIVIMEIVYYQ